MLKHWKFNIGLSLIIIGFLGLVTAFFSIVLCLPVFVMGAVLIFLSQKSKLIKWLSVGIPIVLWGPTVWICLLYLPFQITYHQEITEGNKIANSIDQYYVSFKHLPPQNDTLVKKRLGFKIGYFGDAPDIKNLSDKDYQLTYLEGFDGPYLTYRSTTRQWTMEP